MPQLYNKAVMTNAGLALLNKAQAGAAAIQFTRMATGDGTYAAEEKMPSALRERAGLKSERNSYAISSIDVDSATGVKLTALLTNQDPATGAALVTDGYYLNEIGLYAKEKDGGDDTEALYSVAVAAVENRDYMPAYTPGDCPTQIIQEYRARVSDAADVTVEYAGAVMLEEDFDINAQEPTFEESAKRENINSGERLGAILGKVKKFFADLHQVAFTGSYNDLKDRPAIPSAPEDIEAASASGNFERVGNDNFILYPKGGAYYCEGQTSGGLYIVLPVYFAEFMIAFDVHIKNLKGDVNYHAVYHITGACQGGDANAWDKTMAYCVSELSSAEATNRGVRFGHIPDKNRTAIKIGENSSDWEEAIVQITNVMFYGEPYENISLGWEVCISENENFIEAVKNQWLYQSGYSPNVIFSLFNIASSLSGNLLLGSMLSKSDFYCNQYWTWNGSVNFNNADPFGSRGALGLLLNASDNHLSSTDQNKPIKETGKKYKLSVWMRATQNINGVRITINHYSGSYALCNVTTEWKKFEVTSNSITAITAYNHVVIGGFGSIPANANAYLYIYGPKVEYA